MSMTATATTRPTTRKQTLQERSSIGTTGRVDVQTGIIRGVRVLGCQSRNGRRYEPEAIRRAAGLYEGKQVNANHPSDRSRERSVQDRIGWLENVQVADDGGLRGDLHLLLSHPMTPAILEAAGRNPRLFGLSHNVEGRTRRDERGGGLVVEEITHVWSVDLVSDPATASSLFESIVKAGGWRFPGSKGEFMRRFTEADPAVPELGEPATVDTPSPDTLDDIRGILATDAMDSEKIKAIERLLAADPGPKAESRRRRRGGRAIVEGLRSELSGVAEEIRGLRQRLSSERPTGTGAAAWRFPRTKAETLQRLTGQRPASKSSDNSAVKRLIQR